MLRHVAPILACATECASATMDLTRQTICTGWLSWTSGDCRDETTELELRQGWCWRHIARDICHGWCLERCHGRIVAVDETRSIVPIMWRVIFGVKPGFQDELSILHIFGTDWKVLVQESSNGISIDLIIGQLR
jgi:hypothetical protein